MKKRLNCIIINLIVVFLIIILCECCLFTKEYFRLFDEINKQSISLNKTTNPLSLKQYIKKFCKTYREILNTEIKINKNFFRPLPSSYLQNKIQKKSPIILVGCSYTYGLALSENETFSYLLSKYTGRDVYNLGIGGRSPRTILYLMRENFNYTKTNLLKNNLNIEYIIYTYIPDHKRRLYVNLICNDIPCYKTIKKDNNKHLKFVNCNSLKKTYIYRNIMELVYRYKMLNTPKEMFDIFTLYIKEIHREIQSNFHFNNKKTKFVILVYDEEAIDDWNILKRDDIIVIRIKEDLNINISDKKYKLLDNHPNAKAWQDIVPALVKKLDL